MKIKNFVAANMNEAIALVRQELGSEAIILSNQTISGQVHLTAALEDKVDYDFSAEMKLKLWMLPVILMTRCCAKVWNTMIFYRRSPGVCWLVAVKKTAASAAVMTAEF